MALRCIGNTTNKLELSREISFNITQIHNENLIVRNDIAVSLSIC